MKGVQLWYHTTLHIYLNQGTLEIFQNLWALILTCVNYLYNVRVVLLECNPGEKSV